MSITAQGSLSIKKSDLSSDRTSGTYKKVQFAHKAVGGETGISLASLTTPSSEMPGFVQPSQAELSACQLLFNQKNLVLTSSLRGPLVQFMSYQIASSTQINFTDSFGAALPGEIFVGVIDGTNRDGVNAAATTSIVATGTLSAGSSDFNVGTPFVTNLYPSQQIGAVLVYLDGQLMMRNSGNATASAGADGNYQEVGSGSGYANLIRFNVVDNLNDRAVMVVSNGAMVEQPSGSMKATIETLAGQQDAVIQSVAALAGVPTSNFYAAPNNVDMLSFGNKVLTVEQNAAYKNVSNAWTANQQLLGKTDGVAVAAGYIGEMVGTLRSGTNGYSYSTRNTTSLTTTPSTIISVSLNKGVYIVSYKLHCAGSTVLNMNGILQVGGTSVEVQATRGYASTTVFGTCTNSLPVVISADGTIVSVYGGIDVGTSSSNSHEMFAIRIA